VGDATVCTATAVAIAKPLVLDAAPKRAGA
jgi:hypothetical protein